MDIHFGSKWMLKFPMVIYPQSVSQLANPLTGTTSLSHGVHYHTTTQHGKVDKPPLKI